jgi:hypothetical protein
VPADPLHHELPQLSSQSLPFSGIFERLHQHYRICLDIRSFAM